MSFERDLVRRLAALERELERLKTQERGGIWADWTPTVTQSGSVTVTVTYARYFTAGKLVVLQAKLGVTGTGTTNNAIVISGIPTAIQPASSGGLSVVGTIDIQDTGTAQYVGALIAVGANDLRGLADGLGNYIGITPNFALANTDIISFQAAYERA